MVTFGLGSVYKTIMMRRIAVFLVLLLAGYFLYQNVFLSKGGIKGQPAPQFTASLGDQTVVLKDEIGKKIILVNFWATWCPPCRDEIPLLNDLYKTLPADKFIIISLMEDEANDDLHRSRILNRFKTKVPIDFSVYADKNATIAEAYGTYQMPESYLIGLDGRIIAKQDGAFTSWHIKQLLELIDSELKKFPGV